MKNENRNFRGPVSRHMDPYHEKSASLFTEDAADDGKIEGRNAVTEALRSGHRLDKVYIAKGETDAALAFIASSARSSGAVVVETDRHKLDKMSVTGAHQGVIAIASAKAYSTIDEILATAEQKGEAPLVIVCDEISDPHNLGAIIRTAETAGAHGVIIPKRRSAGVTAIVAKTSAGAIEHMAVARVANLTSALKTLKDNGLWIYGMAAEGSSGLWQTDFTGPTAIVIGSEGDGMSRLVQENCDFLVSIPMHGKISSLNASAAAAVVIYEAVRQRTAHR
jgi:23S rRNA (guanosine2251-2'-O)-methyltransferase